MKLSIAIQALAMLQGVSARLQAGRELGPGGIPGNSQNVIEICHASGSSGDSSSEDTGTVTVITGLYYPFPFDTIYVKNQNAADQHVANHGDTTGACDTQCETLCEALDTADLCVELDGAASTSCTTLGCLITFNEQENCEIWELCDPTTGSCDLPIPGVLADVCLVKDSLGTGFKDAYCKNSVPGDSKIPSYVSSYVSYLYDDMLASYDLTIDVDLGTGYDATLTVYVCSAIGNAFSSCTVLGTFSTVDGVGSTSISGLDVCTDYGPDKFLVINSSIGPGSILTTNPTETNFFGCL